MNEKYISLYALCSCDRASWVKREERKPTRRNNIDGLLSIMDVDYCQYLNMFRAICIYFNPCGGLNIKRLKIIWDGGILKPIVYKKLY